jgi:EpsI family protein
MKSSLRFGVLLVLILVVGVLVNTWSYRGETHVERKHLNDFPQTVGQWQKAGSDRILDDETLRVLRASDYLLRDFRKPEGTVANLYVGYYASQRTGATYHSPLNCLPGSGWTLSAPGKATITMPDGSSFVANKYIIQNGDFKNMMVYWYQGRGRNVASEYWGKIYTVLDSVSMRRSDGAMVRVTIPITDSEEEAERSAIEFASAATAVLPEFVP